YRVVTLTGPGGIGKTTLALVVVHNLPADFEDGRWFVDLSPLADPDLVPSAVMGILGFKLPGHISAEAVARAIGQRRLLPFLHTCVLVIVREEELFEVIARRCPHATVLATSREVLRIEGEYVYRVPPLDVPTLGQQDPRLLMDHSAVELFMTRIAASGSHFA